MREVEQLKCWKVENAEMLECWKVEVLRCREVEASTIKVNANQQCSYVYNFQASSLQVFNLLTFQLNFSILSTFQHFNLEDSESSLHPPSPLSWNSQEINIMPGIATHTVHGPVQGPGPGRKQTSDPGCTLWLKWYILRFGMRGGRRKGGIFPPIWKHSGSSLSSRFWLEGCACGCHRSH